jgi:hypothetical protein
LKVQIAVLIRIEVLNDQEAICFGCLLYSILTKETKYFDRADDSVLIAIDSHESSIWLKFLILGEPLPLPLNAFLSFGYGQQEFLELYLHFMSQLLSLGTPASTSTIKGLRRGRR